MAGGREFDPYKFAEVVLYLADRTRGDGGIAGTALNALLYFCDFKAYRRLGRSITGATYQKLHWGPAAREFQSLPDELHQSGAARSEPNARDAYERVIVPLRRPEIEYADVDELDVIESVLAELRPFDPSLTLELARTRSAGWRAVKDEGDEIPYETAIVSSREPSPEAEAELRSRILSGNWD